MARARTATRPTSATASSELPSRSERLPRKKARRAAQRPLESPVSSAVSDESEDEDYDAVEMPHGNRPLRFESFKMTFHELVDMINKKKLSLTPPYQREFVWTKLRQSNLIQSILEGLPIPNVVFNERRVRNVTGRGYRKEFACIDGRQRLETLHAFVSGRVAGKIPGGTVPRWFMDNDGGKKKKLFTPTEQDNFWRKTFTCYVYRGLSEDMERSMFGRLNEGAVALKAAELLRSKRGVWQDLARGFEDEYEAVQDLCDFKRASGFITLVRAFAQILECRQASVERRKPVFRDSKAFLKRTELHTPENEQILRETFDTFQDLARSHANIFEAELIKHLGCKGMMKFSPIEFVVVSVLVDQYATLDTAELATAISELRINLRRGHRSMKGEKAIWSSAWEYISAYDPANRLSSLMPTYSDVRQRTPAAEPSQTRPRGSKVAAKTKRATVQDKISNGSACLETRSVHLDNAGPASASGPRRKDDTRLVESAEGQMPSTLPGSDTLQSNVPPLSKVNATSAMTANTDHQVQSGLLQSGAFVSQQVAQAPIAPMVARQTPVRPKTNQNQPESSIHVESDATNCRVNLQSFGPRPEPKSVASPNNKRRATSALQDARGGKRPTYDPAA